MLNVYAASKHAVTALTETLRQELCALKFHIRITVSSRLLNNAQVYFLDLSYWYFTEY